MRTEGEGAALKEWEMGGEGGWVGVLTKRWKNKRHTTVGGHEVKVSFLEPFIFILGLHN